MMRNIIYLFLGIFFMSMPKLSAQVRIGSMEDPHPSALLDLNETDSSNTGKHGLALPRVSLVSNTDPLNGTAPLDGMLVYNTNNSVGEGVYYWSINQWLKLSDGAFLEGDAIVGNEVTDVTPDRGLERTGKGTTKEPYTLGIVNNGVQSAMIAPNVVTGDKLSKMNASDSSVLQYDGTVWTPAQVSNVLTIAGDAGLRVKSVRHLFQTTSNGNVSVSVEDMDKTLFFCNGDQDKAPLYIISRDKDKKTIRLPGTSAATASYTIVAIEFY
jgi:hypothetical protein